MNTLFSAKIARTAIAAALALGTAVAAHAQTLIVGGAPVSVGSNFTTLFGKDGSIQFDTFPAGQTSGNFGGLTNVVTQVDAGGNGTPVNLITTPGYVSSIDGITGTFHAAAGYGYPAISPGNEAGLVGDTNGNLFSFTVGTNAPATFTFGVLTNYASAAENPTTITLTSGTASASDTTTSLVAGGSDNLFTIANAAPNSTFTVSISNGFVSGATFDSPIASAPEPSQFATLSIGLVGLGALTLRARKRASQRG